MPKLIASFALFSLAAVQAAEPAPISLPPQPVPAPIVVALPSPPPLAVDAILQHWRHEVAAPRLAALAQQGRALADAAGALCERTNQERLDTARARWIDTFLAWRAAQALPLDPVLVKAIEPGTVELQQVEAAVRNSSDDKPIPDDVAPTAVGLKTLEYLYWGNDLPKAQLGRLAFRRRCAYSAAVAETVSRNLDAAVSRPPATASDYIARLSSTLALVRSTRLAHLGKGKAPSLPDFDGWRSQQTKAALVATLGTLESLLLEPGKEGQSVLDALNSSSRSELAAQIQAVLADVHGLLDKLPPDIAAQFTRHPESAQPLMAALTRLQGLVDGPLTQAFGTGG